MAHPARSGGALAPGRARRLLARLRGRPDSEHEMGFNRIIMGIGTLVYALAIRAAWPSIVVPCAYIVAAVAILAIIARDSRIRPVRRVIVLLIDMASCSFMMIYNGAATAALYPMLLWTILGNGFRFGVSYLYVATGAAALFFSLVLAATPFWRGEPALGVGLLIGLIGVPLYTSTLIRKLSTAKKEAEEASRAKSYFLASVSHELRTPLTAIIGLGAHLHQSEMDDERRATTETIVSAGRSLLAMINRLLDFSRVEAEGGRVAHVPFELPQLLRGVRDLLLFNAQEKGLLLGVSIGAGTPLLLTGDLAHLRDVLVNLVGNAVKFTDRGAIMISAEAATRDDGRPLLRLAVSDTGIGIAPEAQEQIFGSFVQADDTIIDRYGGTGLGLAICKQLATLLGGEIGVESEPGRGSTFWFTARVERTHALDAPLAAPAPTPLLFHAPDGALPEVLADHGAAVTCVADEAALAEAIAARPDAAVIVDARVVGADADLAALARLLGRSVAPILLATRAVPRPARALFVAEIDPDADAAALAEAVAIAAAFRSQPAPLPSDADGAGGRRLQVLVADDNVMNQKVLGMMLRRAGHDVTAVPDGEVALDRMKDHMFDLVLMDVNMPVLNGIEATKLYRFASLGQPRVPIVGVTADASPATAERCLDAGMDACIEKPVEAEQLLALIEQLAGDAAAAPASPPAFDPAGVVTPLFRIEEAGPPAIDWASLEELDELGGRAFVAELVDVYLADAAGLLDTVREAVEAGDVAAFRKVAHAFRSSAANIGAVRVAELCQHYQRIGTPEFETRGRSHIATLERELARVAATLREREDWVRAASA